MKVGKSLLIWLVLSMALTTAVKAENQESLNTNLNEKWINTSPGIIEMTVKGTRTGFKIIRNTSPKDGFPFYLVDTDSRVTDCENGLGFCKEQARIKYEEIQEFNGTSKK